MSLKLIKIFVLITILFNGCTENKKNEPLLGKEIFNTQNDQIKNFFYVGKEGKKLCVFKYDFEKRKSIKFWSDRKEKVILLDYSPNLKHLYFLTAKYYGIRSTLPYIKRLKLYSIDLHSEKVLFTDSLMNGTQINAGWISDNSFKVIINSRDIKVSEYMNMHTFIYNNMGKKLLSEIETINFIKDGYPLPVINKGLKKSNKNFQLLGGSFNQDSLYLFDKTKNEKSFIIYLNNKKLNNIYWSDDYLIFTIKGIEKENNLIVYSTKTKKIVKQFKRENIKNFLVFSKYLVYDYGLGFSSSISIFNLKKSQIADSIKFNGGCGLKSVL